ncbi:MAG: hypothetical protein RIC51_05200 [Erythrobacter sp.]|uniref:hypothetical protein n=1 Tax=Erythrobacter sp. TaxID=1042 RepID=UPI0032EAE8FE
MTTDAAPAVPAVDEAAYSKPLSPELRKQLADMAEKQRAPKKAKKKPAKRKPKAGKRYDWGPPQHNAHVLKARPFLIAYRAAQMRGHRVPLSFHYSAPVGSLIWDYCDCDYCRDKRAKLSHSTT